MGAIAVRTATLSITTLNILPFNITTGIIITLNITIVSIMTLSREKSV
jgi:hypothetical protein